MNEWNWDLGDGTFSSVQTSTHSYTTPGAYTVAVEINATDGVYAAVNKDAVLAYETALALNERNTVPLNNLYSIYDEDGETEKAAAIQQRVERNRSRNPYYLHYLAESAFAEHALDEAIDYANRAIRIEDREYRFYYTLAQLQYRTGHESRARLNLRKAIRLAPEWVDQGSLVLPGEAPERETEDG